MTPSDIRTADAAASRPRVIGLREDAILDGVLEVVERVGYERTTFDLVAAEVKASKATLYRKWPTKAELVISALDRMAPAPGGLLDIDTGTLAGDLEVLGCSDPDWSSRTAVLFRSVLSAKHEDPELRAVFHQRFVAPRQEFLATLLRRAQRRGEIGADADLNLLGEILPAMAIHHATLTESGPETCYLRDVIEHVLLPACRATVTPGAPAR